MLGPSADFFDVLIVGAGLSGIGAAYRIQNELPSKRYAILEAREAIGGTWDLFRYPGVRSDSDMFTLGYPFHPWKGPHGIASGEEIRAYITEVADTYGIREHIHFSHRVTRADFDSTRSMWIVEVDHGGELKRFQCHFFYVCSGYYRYDAAHQPQFKGQERFRGQMVHPQWWPQDLEVNGKRVVVIGSGATAVTLVPSLAKLGAQVTMLQRSPTYILSQPAEDGVARWLKHKVSDEAAYKVVRAKNLVMSSAFYQFCRRAPKLARQALKLHLKQRLPSHVPFAPHFQPSYNPWDQRLCLVPDDDLFQALQTQQAQVVTGHIASFEPDGVRLADGALLEADIVVTATGLELLALGGIALSVDERPVEVKESLVYKGCMLSDVPNLAWCVGYTNASWTLRADLTSRFVCRLLRMMKVEGYAQVCAKTPERLGFRDLLGLNSGYVQRAASALPRQGDRAPWVLRQNYALDFMTMRVGPVRDEGLVFCRGGQASRVPPTLLQRALGQAHRLLKLIA